MSKGKGDERRSPIISLHALGLSAFPVGDQRCETCGSKLHHLIVGWSVRNSPTSTERLAYCVKCDSIEQEASGPWSSSSS